LIVVTLNGDGCHRISSGQGPECSQLMGAPAGRQVNETHWHAGGAQNKVTSLLPSAPEKGRSLGVLSAIGLAINDETAA